MEWGGLWHQFLSGNPAAVSAIFAGMSCLFTFFGLFYIGRNFSKQAEINRLILEKDKREIRPVFKVDSVSFSKDFAIDVKIALFNAVAFDIVVTEFDLDNKILSTETHKSLAPPETYSYHFQYDSLNTVPEILLTIKFHDEDGRQYFSRLKTNGKKPYLTFPTLITPKSKIDAL